MQLVMRCEQKADSDSHLKSLCVHGPLQVTEKFTKTKNRFFFAVELIFDPIRPIRKAPLSSEVRK